MVPILTENYNQLGSFKKNTDIWVVLSEISDSLSVGGPKLSGF